MTILHFIPNDEDGVHRPNSECDCKPEILPSEMYSQCTEIGTPDICYEHFPFSPTTDLSDYIVHDDI